MFCTNCGTRIPENGKFCVSCGQASTTEQPPIGKDHSSIEDEKISESKSCNVTPIILLLVTNAVCVLLFLRPLFNIFEEIERRRTIHATIVGMGRTGLSEIRSFGIATIRGWTPWICGVHGPTAYHSAFNFLQMSIFALFLVPIISGIVCCKLAISVSNSTTNSKKNEYRFVKYVNLISLILMSICSISIIRFNSLFSAGTIVITPTAQYVIIFICVLFNFIVAARMNALIKKSPAIPKK